MNDSENAYAQIVDTLGRVGAERAAAGTLRIYLGTVLQVDPLVVDVCGTQQRQDEGRLWCNPALLAGDLGGVLLSDVAGALTIAPIGDSALLTATGGSLRAQARRASAAFSAGDQLLMLTPDQQTFYILSKEVRL